MQTDKIIFLSVILNEVKDLKSKDRVKIRLWV